MFAPVTDISPTIGKSNELINALYSMPTSSHRLVMLALSQIRYSGDDMADLDYYVTVSAQQWMDTFTSTPGSVYDQIRQGAEYLQHTTSATIRLPSDTRKSGYRRVQWFSQVEYQQDLGFIELWFGKQIRPFISQLSRDFTIIDLQALRDVRRSHSIRLYELLRQYRSTGWRHDSLLELKDLFGVAEKYPRWVDFRKRVLDSAVSELNDKTSMAIKYEVIKKGRAVSAIKFRFTDKLTSV